MWSAKGGLTSFQESNGDTEHFLAPSSLLRLMLLWARDGSDLIGLLRCILFLRKESIAFPANQTWAVLT
jgi:hypothetical protein